MAKFSTARKKEDSMKSKRVRMAAAAMNDVEDDDEEQLSPDDENVISASEDEEGSDDERKHAKLLEAISSLGGRRRKKHVERSEASVQVSEFSVTAGGAEEKINLCDLLGTMEKTPGAPSKTKKQLRNLQNCKETLELPLSKQQTEKIQRTVAYEKSTKEVSRWESVIIQNQKAEQLVFPLKQEPAGPKRMEQVVAGWKAQTPLEQEIFSILHSNKQPVLDPVLTPMEKAAIKAMSLEEAKIRRAELQKARALQSYYEAKAKRGKRIKSKKYHRVQKKAKQKEFLKQFDEMMKTNPTAALEELKKMELSRMEERMSLKHQNSGKWAKSRAIMAKYDESARSAMQEQLQLNKELTQKLVVPSDDEEERRAEEEANALPDFVNEAEPVPDSANPWMRGKLTSEASGPDVSDVAAEPGVSDVAAEPSSGQEGEQHREEEEEEEQEEEEEKLLREFERKRKLRRNEEDDLAPQPREERGRSSPVDMVEQVTREEVVGEDVEISDDEEEDDEEEDDEEEGAEVVSEFNSLFNRLMQSGRAEPQQIQAEEAELLDEGLVYVRTMDDLEALGQDEMAGPSNAVPDPHTQTPSAEATTEPPSKKKKEIDPKEVLTKEAKTITVPLVLTAVEEEEESFAEQAAIIKEAFAGDDVISDFLKDKRKQEEAGRPKVVDLTLPGWGEWGGVGLKPSRQKRRKFRLKAAAAPPRKDQKLPAVIISEKRNASIAAHQVSQLPFPFQNSAQFESCMRSPVGQTWNTQNTVKKLTAPRVVTKLGAIIQPMAKEDFLKQKKGPEAAKQGAIPLRGTRKKGKKKDSR
ncbi:U3 small nucleolar RNA-associated protein 14 homolog A isoform X1 [Electrophorus electricus]|uniref:UTP14C small subunit processome component n=1 Tax=Electrophorus electricus TaxID=8005 RepID=A0A4W4G4R0_ELEEL|nr:U3 small nucleolar RNA-associated protein 14 homolog A isoform X1 [Electrophorus electricus]